MATLGGFIFPNQSFQHLKKGDIAPDFTTASIDGKEITLSSFTQKGNVVILFYQGFWCTGCNKQLNTFKADLAKITKKGGHTIAISPAPLTGTRNDFIHLL